MTSHIAPRRSRIIALATGAVLSLSVVAAPAAVVAQETPEEAVLGVFQAMEEWRFGDIAGFFCADQADAAAALDIGAQMGQFLGGISPEMLQAALQIDVVDPTVEILSQDETTARARIQAGLALSVVPEGARALVLALFESLSDEPPPDAIIDETIAEMTESLTSDVETLDEEVDIVLVDGAWKVCSPVGPGASDSMDDEMSDDEMSDDASPEATEGA